LVLENNPSSTHVSVCSFDDRNKRVCFQTNDENLKQRVKIQFDGQSFKYDNNKFVKMIFNDENDLEVQITSGWLQAIPMQKNTTSPEAKTYQDIKTHQEIKTTLESIRPDIKKLLAQRRSVGPTL
jgi:hypothetical protein